METFFLFLAFSPRLPTFINIRTKGFQSHHKEDCVFNAHAHVAVELSVLAIKFKFKQQVLSHEKRMDGIMITKNGTYPWSFVTQILLHLFACLMLFNATFNNISVISWRSVLLVEETGVPGENHRPAASHRYYCFSFRER